MALTVSVLNQTLDALLTMLETVMITNVTDEDDVANVAQYVITGRLQDDPTPGTGVTIALFTNHPVDPEKQAHEIAASSNLTSVGLDVFPTRELGGGSMYWRRYTVQVDVFDLNEADRAVPRKTAQIVLSRLENALRRSVPHPIGPDDFTEQTLLGVVTDSFIREGGGPSNYNWRGEVLFQTLNAVPGCF